MRTKAEFATKVLCRTYCAAWPTPVLGSFHLGRSLQRRRPAPMGCTRSLLQRWLCHLKVVLSHRADALYAAALRDCMPAGSPGLHSVAVRCARHWGVARCGDGRAAQHRTRNAAAIASAAPCRFCTWGTDSLAHALLQ